MATLRVIPYNYVPTKPRPRNNDQRSSVKHPVTYHITQQSKPGVLPERALSPGDARGVGGKSRHNDAYAGVADEPARRGIQDPASIPNAKVSLSGVVADQITLGGETGDGQIEFTENSLTDIDLLSDIDLDSLFGDIDALFEGQEVDSAIECNGGHATNPYTDPSAGQTESLASGKGFGKANTPSSCSSQLTKQSTSTKRRREGDHLSVVINGSNSDSGISDESDDESIFEVRQSKRSKSGSLTSSPDSSIYSSDVEEVIPKLSTHRRVLVADFIEREHERPAIGPGGTSNLIHDINPQTDDCDLDSDDNTDELCHDPSWFRFGPSLAKSHSDDVLPSFARSPYVARVEDAWRDREFHNIIGVEFINGEKHYMLDWVPTLVRGRIVQKAGAQALISSFEARCQSYKEEGMRHGGDRSIEYGTTDGTQQRKRRGRPRKKV